MFDDYLRLPDPNARGLALKVVGYVAAIGLAVFFYHLYQVRMMVKRAQRQHGVVSKPLSTHFLQLHPGLQLQDAPRSPAYPAFGCNTSDGNRPLYLTRFSLGTFLLLRSSPLRTKCLGLLM